jgi:hypothetical protein
MISRKDLEETLDEILTREVATFLATVPYAAHLTDSTQVLNDAYYVRHRIETIKRIRMTSRTDALALAKMVEEDYESARLWGKYTIQELNHDLLFLADLKEHGYTEKMVMAVPPFASTEALVSYIARQIDAVGSIAAVAYSVFVEWNSERYSVKVVEKATETYSDKHTRGAKAHVGIDDHLDHYGLMLDIAHRLIARHGDERILVDLILMISKHLRDYFSELFNACIEETTLRTS